ncbi:radical SAM protein [Clostridium sp. AF32-12BH]|uniref:radical SAM protein n=1 Tax=Clostridium sp. AF32-12BH TaxID=2292006 RepID=UPI000E4D754E|nr:radical SAM protein [Clostridium sp. AF32-12BH]RHP47076.1 4Fe-4S cluster-binding domain-containing protein [Clostridium sp. AF32-12BH]
MEIIKSSNKTIFNILGEQIYYLRYEYRKSYYQYKTNYNDVVLLENTLTQQIIAMSKQEYENPTDEIRSFLVRNWYMLPNDVAEKTLSHMVESSFKYRNKADYHGIIDSFVIFTTMKCNANCPYCYEKGRSQPTMTMELATDVVKFIESKHGDNQVNLHWFGGEPLVNSDIITYICGKLSADNVPYKSHMISNGFLFNSLDMDMVVNKWKLKDVQITLDGTEEEYNKIKAFNGHFSEGFKTVISSIHKLVDNGIQVTIRMNQSHKNYKNLIELTNYIANEFSDKVSAYAHPLFADKNNKLTDEEWSQTYEGYIQLDKALKECKLRGIQGVSTLRPHHCMADSDHMVCITSEGKLTLCEHFSETEIVGDIWNGITDTDLVNEWKEPAPELDECATCWKYPKCFKLKKCEVSDECKYGAIKFEEYLEDQAIRITYKRYLQRVNESSKVSTQQQINLIPDRVVKLAESEVGYSLENRDYGNEIFGKRRHSGWCLPFIYDIFKRAYSGNFNQVFGFKSLPAVTHQLKKLFQNQNRIYNVPQVGDLVFYNHNGWTDHIGLVSEVDDTAQYFSSVEGNVIIDNVSQVVKHEHISVNDESIVGFGRPNYRIDKQEEKEVKV